MSSTDILSFDHGFVLGKSPICLPDLGDVLSYGEENDFMDHAENAFDYGISGLDDSGLQLLPDPPDESVKKKVKIKELQGEMDQDDLYRSSSPCQIDSVRNVMKSGQSSRDGVSTCRSKKKTVTHVKKKTQQSKKVNQKSKKVLKKEISKGKSSKVKQSQSPKGVQKQTCDTKSGEPDFLVNLGKPSHASENEKSKLVLPKSASLSTVHGVETSSPSTTSILLAKMGEAVSAPKYTSPSVSDSFLFDIPSCPQRSSWPMLRELISTPTQSTISISGAPRQTLSTVHVEPVVEEEPAPSVVSKLEKEIRCICTFNKGRPCWLLFNEERLRKERLHHLKMKRESLDLVILAKIAANINREEKVKKSKKQKRQRCRLCYYHEGRKICRETFLFIHGICKGRLCALMKHYKQEGISARVHGNKANIPHHALSFDDSERVLEFIRDYASKNCISSFGCNPGSKITGGLVVLSPSQSKLYVHHKYKLWCAKNSLRAVSLRSFQNLWAKHLQHIVVLRGSNKVPVPEPGSAEALQELNEDSEDDGTPPAAVTPSSKSMTTASNPILEASTSSYVSDDSNNILKIPHVNATHCTDSEQQNYLDVNDDSSHAVIDGDKQRKKRKKAVSSRNIDPLDSYQLSLMSGTDLESHQLFDTANIPMPNTHHIGIGSGLVSSTDDDDDSDDNDETDNGPQTVVKASTTQQDLRQQALLLQHPLAFSPDSLIPCAAPVQPPQQTLATLALPSGVGTPVMLTTPNKEILCAYTSGSPVHIDVVKNASLHPALYLTQPSQLLDAYSLHQGTPDRLATAISSVPTILTDQPQMVLLASQATDLQGHLDWQSW